MKKIILLLLLPAVLLLSACTHPPKQSLYLDKMGKSTPVDCLQRCDNHFEACLQTCHDSCPSCQKVAFQQALKGYYRYCRQLSVQGGYKIRQLNSYRDPLKCRKVSCNCPADHNACLQACGGIISKSLRRVPVCT